MNYLSGSAVIVDVWEVRTAFVSNVFWLFWILSSDFIVFFLSYLFLFNFYTFYLHICDEFFSVDSLFWEKKSFVEGFYDIGWLNCFWVRNYLLCSYSSPTHPVLWLQTWERCVLVYTVVLHKTILGYLLVKFLLCNYLESSIFLTY